MDNDFHLDQFSLWPHQVDSITKVQRYISEFRRGNTTGSALVHLPTGSGKTGVISVLSRCIPEVRCALILAPRIALRDQLVRDVGGKFFNILERKSEKIPKKVIKLAGSLPPIQNIQELNETVFVSTIQKIFSAAKMDHKWFSDYSEQVSLLIIDEGHYEPALSWSQVVRNFKCPKVLFTATPYRNDLKIFDLDLRYAYSLTYQEAVEQNFLRSIEFVPMKPTNDPGRFVDDLIHFYDNNFNLGEQEHARVIIRCESSSSIRQIAEAIVGHNRSCVAIHERFTPNQERPWERKHVPDPKSENATFWIHQFKMLEGIDDARFRMVALFEPLDNARSLVQQIGRIVRNPNRSPNEKGFVLDHSDGVHLNLWEGYLNYDRTLREEGKKALNLTVGEGLVPKFLSIQPTLTYIDGKFRSIFSLADFNPFIDLQIPLRVNLLKKDDAFNINILKESIKREYAEQDREFSLINIDEATFILIYITYRNSPFLRESCFMDCKLGVTVVRDMGEILAYFDTTSRLPLYIEEAGISGVVKPSELQRLFKDGNKSRITYVSLKNSNVGVSNIRSRSMSAVSIEDIAPGFDDYAQICSIIEGYSEDNNQVEKPGVTRRYLGMNSGRVTQSSRFVPLGKYFDWLNELITSVNENRSVPHLFKRYAIETIEPGNTEVKNILLDVEDVKESYCKVGSNNSLYIEELCKDVNNGEFTISANETMCRVHIEYDAQRKRYKIASPDLERVYRLNQPDEQTLPSDLVTYLNRTQSFRVIPETDNVLYVQGIFYLPLLKFGGDYGRDHIELEHLLIDREVLRNVTTEKGSKCKDNGLGWEQNSLFDIIDNLGNGYGMNQFFDNPNILICDDMNKEIADFILCDSSSNRIALIHAKASDKRRVYSASALQEVCSQAIKNIRFLSWANSDKPPNFNLWSRGWSASKVDGNVTARIRRGAGDPDELWDEIRYVIRSPNSNKEVWLFLGNTLSKSEFSRQIRLDRPAPEAVQAAYLLHSTWECISTVGAKLRVFCFP